MRQHDCEPTLNDTEVLEFCKNGFMMFEGVVSDEINRRTNEYLDEHDGMEPTDILDEDWFMDGVIKHPAVAGALRSLLGKDFGLPNLVSNHRIQCPQPAQEWHYDGGDIFGPQLNYIQVFYYPQDCPRELGPTELLPGSHFLYSREGHDQAPGQDSRLIPRRLTGRLDLPHRLLHLAQEIGVVGIGAAQQRQVQLLAYLAPDA